MLLELYNHGLLFLLDFRIPNWPQCLARSKQLSINVIFSVKDFTASSDMMQCYHLLPILSCHSRLQLDLRSNPRMMFGDSKGLYEPKTDNKIFMIISSQLSLCVSQNVNYISSIPSGPNFLTQDIEAARLKCVMIYCDKKAPYWTHSQHWV